jgi:nucleoside-diphosphate-sugar epimerase
MIVRSTKTEDQRGDTMKVLVAGATGAIGRTLIPLLIQADHAVVGIAKNAAEARSVDSLGALPVVVDVFDREQLCAIVRDERPDAIIDQLTDLRTSDYTTNDRLRTEGTRNLVDAALSVGVDRIVTQSFCIYAPGPGLARESDPLEIRSNADGRSVDGIVALERAVGEVAHGVILRYGTLYGPDTSFSPASAVAEQVRKGAVVANDDLTSFLHIADAAGAVLSALSWPKGPVNVVDDEPARGRDWMPVFAEAIGAPPPRGAAHYGNTPGSMPRAVSNAKARNELSWHPRYPTWREGFRMGLGARTQSNFSSSRPSLERVAVERTKAADWPTATTLGELRARGIEMTV